jgi:hypothetical protein
MAWTHTNTPVLASGATTSPSGAFGSNVALGSLMVGVSANLGTANGFSVSDTALSTWHYFTLQTQSGLTMNGFWAFAAASVANTVTATWTGTGATAASSLIVDNFLGGSAGSPVDQLLFGNGTTGAPNTANISPGQNNELVFVGAALTTGVAQSAGSGFTGFQQEDFSTTLTCMTQYQIQTTKTTIPTAFGGSPSTFWDCYAVSFLLTSGGSGGGGTLPLLGVGHHVSFDRPLPRGCVRLASGLVVPGAMGLKPSQIP